MTFRWPNEVYLLHLGKRPSNGEHLPYRSVQASARPLGHIMMTCKRAACSTWDKLPACPIRAVKHFGSRIQSAMKPFRLASLLALLFVFSSLQAQDSKPRKEDGPFKHLKFRLVGPAAGGRVSRACGVPGDPMIYYVGAASGGVWKTTDGGFTWKPIFDDQPTSTIGAIAVAAVRSQRRLRRLRRGQHPRQRRAGQRHLQVHQRRQDLEARLEAEGPDRPHHRPSQEPRHRLRRGPGPRLRAQSRARRLSHHRRRQDLEAGADARRPRLKWMRQG